MADDQTPQAESTETLSAQATFRVTPTDKAAIDLIRIVRKASEPTTSESEILRSFFDFDGLRSEALRLGEAMKNASVAA